MYTLLIMSALAAAAETAAAASQVTKMLDNSGVSSLLR